MAGSTFTGDYGSNAPGMLRYLRKIDLVKTLRKKFRPETRALFAAFPERHAIGTLAPDFQLRTIDGRTVTLSEFRRKKHVVLEFGSYS